MPHIKIYNISWCFPIREGIMNIMIDETKFEEVKETKRRLYVS